MSKTWPGGLINKTPVTPTGPLQNGTAPGMWSMADAAYWIKQGLWPTAGNFLAVEDVFSTWLYTGTGAAQTITNGINLSGQGGLVWTKGRNNPGYALRNALVDTVRGATQNLYSDGTEAQSATSDINAFTSTGYNFVGAPTGYQNNAGNSYVSWTFREAPNFFDVVTWTGNGASGFRTFNHNLGVTPGCIFVKAVSDNGAWYVYHVGTGDTKALFLNTTGAAASVDPGQTGWSVSSTTFGINATQLGQNSNGVQYIAYLFAHDTSSTGLIQCGSYTGTGSDLTVNLGWEPQWWLVKNTTTAGWSWSILDNMRGFSAASDNILQPNSSNAELTTTNISLTPTGVQYASTGNGAFNSSGATYIYIAIRRGPMKTPTVGTSVFSPITYTGTGSNNRVLTGVGFASDAVLFADRTGIGYPDKYLTSKLASVVYNLATNTSGSQQDFTGYGFSSFGNTSLTLGSLSGNGYNYSPMSVVLYAFGRAPGFMDVVCYTGTGVSGQTISHNLGVAPELIIIKKRNAGSAIGWFVGGLFNSSDYKQIYLNKTDQADTVPYNAAFPSQPTATQFAVSSYTDVGASAQTYVAYLFASCPGVSKVGSYTGTGALQTINCGFTTGARFVLIKRMDSTGDWYVWNSATGITSGNDPYILLNSTAPEVTGTNYVDTDTTGFQVTAAAPAGINANGGSYIFLAVA